MVVKLDLSQLPSTLRSIFLHQSELAEQIEPEPNMPDIVTIHSKDESRDAIDGVKRRIKDTLIQFKIRDFVAITDPMDKQKILVITKKEAEKLDSFHCHHCGMEFIDEIQLGIHQRLHLPF